MMMLTMMLIQAEQSSSYPVSIHQFLSHLWSIYLPSQRNTHGY